MRRRRVRLPEEDLVDLDEEILPETLAELRQHAVLERTRRLEGLQPEEVLVGHVAGDFRDKLAVAQVGPLLDDERAESHPCRCGRTSATGLEERAVLGLDGAPVDHVGEDDPLVLGIEFHSAGLVEPVEGQLLCFFGLVHAMRSPKCGDIRHPRQLCLHIVYHFKVNLATKTERFRLLMI